MKLITCFTAALLFAGTCSVALAQTTAAPAASQPAAVGVSTETAKAANDQAIKRSDVATVVKTGPTVGDRARRAEASVESRAAGSATTDGTSIAGYDRAGNANRAPRADRN